MRGYSLTLLGSVVLSVLSVAACSVYDAAMKICVSPDCQKTTGGRSGEGGGGGGDGGSSANGGVGGSAAGTSYCNAGARAIYPPQPAGVASSMKNVEIVAGQYRIELGDDVPNPANPPKKYLTIGFDLDNT